MKVKELIEILSQLPENSLVMVNGYEGGVSDVSDVEEVKVELNVNSTWYYGAHETTLPDRELSDKVVNAVRIS